jgi:protein-S-isoprenylcysteine O-methyltransferase Ste14
MQAFELKIPPPMVMALMAVSMYFASAVLPPVHVDLAPRLAFGLLLGASGLAVNIAGLMAFRRYRTTVNPLQPGRASSLVCDGIFARTRNPMYLGMVLMLTGWAVFLANFVVLLGPMVLFVWLWRFQIVPEERALRSNFPSEFATYAARVRPWL